MPLSTRDIVSLVVAALLAGILLPIGLTGLVDVGNYVVNATAGTTFADIAPAALITLIGTVVPIIIVISVLLGFLRGQ